MLKYQQAFYVYIELKYYTKLTKLNEFLFIIN